MFNNIRCILHFVWENIFSKQDLVDITKCLILLNFTFHLGKFNSFIKFNSWQFLAFVAILHANYETKI